MACGPHRCTSMTVNKHSLPPYDIEQVLVVVCAGVHDSEQGEAQQGGGLPQHQGRHCLSPPRLPFTLQVRQGLGVAVRVLSKPHINAVIASLLQGCHSPFRYVNLQM